MRCEPPDTSKLSNHRTQQDFWQQAGIDAVGMEWTEKTDLSDTLIHLWSNMHKVATAFQFRFEQELLQMWFMMSHFGSRQAKTCH